MVKVTISESERIFVQLRGMVRTGTFSSFIVLVSDYFVENTESAKLLNFLETPSIPIIFF